MNYQNTNKNGTMRPETDREKHLVQVLLAQLRGIPVEFYIKPKYKGQKWNGDWHLEELKFLNIEDCEYRIKQKEPLTLPKEVWNYIDPKWNFIAQDNNGKFYRYTRRPSIDYANKQWYLVNGNNYDIRQLSDLHIDTQNYNWHETLIERPKDI